MAVKILSLFSITFLMLGTILGQSVNKPSVALQNKSMEQQVQQSAKKYQKWAMQNEKEFQKGMERYREIMRQIRNEPSKEKKEELRLKESALDSKKDREWLEKHTKSSIKLLNKRFGEKIIFSRSEKGNFGQSAFWGHVHGMGGDCPLNEFYEMSGGIKRSKELKKESDGWINLFLDKKYRPQSPPAKYYLGTDACLSTLYYSWNVEKYQLTMFETRRGVLLEMTLKNGKPFRPTPKELDALIKKMINTAPRGDRIPYDQEYDEKIISFIPSFNLPRRVKEGDIFINGGGGFIVQTKYGWQPVKDPIPQVQKDGYIYPKDVYWFGGPWRQGIVGFASKKGLCITLNKYQIHTGVMSLKRWAIPQPVGKWLRKGLIFPEK